jgi:exodeoxyribonuclease V alpha subunit
MARGSNYTITAVGSASYRRAPAQSGPLQARTQHGDQPFAATVTFKLFPKAGQPEKEDGFTIARVTHETTGESLVMKGKFGPVVEGQLVQIKKGAWRDDPRFGEHYQVWAVSHEDPVTRDALLGYLQHLPGVGDALANAIVDQFGTRALVAIDADPSLLGQVKTAGGRGISQTQLDEVMASWEKLRSERKNMLYLSSLELGDASARKAIDHFGPATASFIKADPYRLTEVDGIGFRTADLVAQKLGIGANDPRRISAGVEYVIQTAEGDGHVCLSRAEVLERAPKILIRDFKKPSEEEVETAIASMIEAGRLWAETDAEDGTERIYTRELYVVETRLYEHLEQLLSAPKRRPPAFFTKPADSPVTDEQWKAVENAFSERLSVLTGGPGVGKTFTLRTMLDQLDHQGQTYACLAPTGKAAKRMEESTGREASTIHRKLGWKGRSAPNAVTAGVPDEQRFPEDVIIVDEASMLDMRLAERLLSHVAENGRVVLVGDPHQLPAVGAGSVLLDLIESERVPMTRLNQVFRQAEDSLLVVNSHRIKEGIEPFWNSAEAEKALGHPVREDWRFVEVADGPEAISATLKLADELPATMGITNDEVLITAPSRLGGAGVYALNQAMQHKRNPSGQDIRQGDQPLRVGDRVMNIQNRYGRPKSDESDIMNGDIGVIDHYDAAKRTTWVRYDFANDLVPYAGSDQLDALIPCYAATTHKLQGSEAPAIVAPVIGGQGSRMLSRNLLYTAWTRAKEQCVVVGSKDIIRDAISRDGTRRNTTLDLRVGRISPRLKARWELMNTHHKTAQSLFYGRRNYGGAQYDQPNE